MRTTMLMKTTLVKGCRSWTTATTTAILRRSHYSYSGPGSYTNDTTAQLHQTWQGRDFDRRGFTVGIGGPVGSGKTALVYQLCRRLAPLLVTPSSPLGRRSESGSDIPNMGVVTNDIFTQEDTDFLHRQAALPWEGQIRAVETGGCPHAAIREDVSANLQALESLTLDLRRRTTAAASSQAASLTTPPLLLCESGGDNLAANFSRELADLTLYVIDVAGGDKIPRKGGPGVTQSDLLVINKVDLAEAVGADLQVMYRDAMNMRGPHGRIVMASIKHGPGLPDIQAFILQHYHQALQIHYQKKLQHDHQDCCSHGDHDHHHEHRHDHHHDHHHRHH